MKTLQEKTQHKNDLKRSWPDGCGPIFPLFKIINQILKIKALLGETIKIINN